MIKTRTSRPSWVVLAMMMVSIGLIVLSSCSGTGSKTPVGDHRGEQKMTPKSIAEVLNEHTDEWMAIPGVVGTAIGEYNGKPCIKVLVIKKTKDLVKQIPSQVEGFPVAIEETGEIRALDPE